jgi:hypothetical protein
MYGHRAELPGAVPSEALRGSEPPRRSDQQQYHRQVVSSSGDTEQSKQANDELVGKQMSDWLVSWVGRTPVMQWPRSASCSFHQMRCAHDVHPPACQLPLRNLHCVVHCRASIAHLSPSSKPSLRPSVAALILFHWYDWRDSLQVCALALVASFPVRSLAGAAAVPYMAAAGAHLMHARRAAERHLARISRCCHRRLVAHVIMQLGRDLQAQPPWGHEAQMLDLMMQIAHGMRGCDIAACKTSLLHCVACSQCHAPGTLIAAVGALLSDQVQRKTSQSLAHRRCSRSTAC